MAVVLATRIGMPFQFTHPGRGATALPLALVDNLLFQFTHPGRGATTPRYKHVHNNRMVSIHAPREGCDVGGCILLTRRQSFNSRTPGGVRLGRIAYEVDINGGVQFTHPGRGATRECFGGSPRR